MEFMLRPATANDAAAIRRLIHRVHINPMGLDWHRFVLAVDASGNLLGCGQLKPHSRGVLELASIAVAPECRGNGMARAIIDRLIVQAPRPIYLTCRSSLGVFYERWGFRVADVKEMPAYFRRLSRLATTLMRIGRYSENLLVMVLK